jgi:hypothetical protein
MRTLILATASAIALGVASAGSPLYAAGNDAGTLAQATPPATQTAPSGTMQPTTPQPGATDQQVPPSMSGNVQTSSPDMANTSQGSMNWPRVTSSDVQQAQQKLAQEGLYHGRIDGTVGPATQRAIRAYQRRSGLPVTATLDPQTLASLNGSGTGVGSSTPSSSPSGTEMTPPSSAGASGINTPPAPSTSPGPGK